MSNPSFLVSLRSRINDELIDDCPLYEASISIQFGPDERYDIDIKVECDDDSDEPYLRLTSPSGFSLRPKSAKTLEIALQDTP